MHGQSKNRPHLELWTTVVLFLLVASVGYYKFHPSNHAQASEPTTSSTQPAQNDAALQQIIAKWANNQSFKTAVTVVELKGGNKSASYNPLISMDTASTYKLYVAYAILHNVEQASYTLKHVTSDGHNIQTDLNTMIVNSDNDAGRTLGFLAGWQNIDAFLKTQGIKDTELNNYVPPSTNPVGEKHTTVTDMAAFLSKLYGGKLLNAADTQMLINLMKNQAYRERIPAGVPKGVPVADKPGWLDPAAGDSEYVQNDAAIVYGPKSTYVLVIMTRAGSAQPLASLSSQIYQYLES